MLRLVAELDAPAALLSVVLAVPDVVHVPGELSIRVELGGPCGYVKLWVLLQHGLVAVFLRRHRQTLRRSEGDFALGRSLETLFLTRFAGTAENAGDDLDAAQTGDC